MMAWGPPCGVEQRAKKGLFDGAMSIAATGIILEKSMQIKV
jgi:hypothetical protein